MPAPAHDNFTILSLWLLFPIDGLILVVPVAEALQDEDHHLFKNDYSLSCPNFLPHTRTHTYTHSREEGEKEKKEKNKIGPSAESL